MKECTQTDNRTNVQKLKYNFVFLFAGDDYWQAILGKELYDCENVHVYQGAFEGSQFLKKLFKLHWAYRINAKVNLPLKSLWFSRMYRQKFDNDLPLCFVFMGGNSIRFDGGFSDYVRKKDPRNKVVVIHNDLIAKKCLYDYSLVRNKVDLAVTYDKQEAQKYGIHYFQETTYSKLVEEPEHVEFEQDVYFLGAAKDRLPKILAVYRKLCDAGVKCKFQIAGVSKENQVPGEGLEYISGIPYKESLNHIIHSKCVLELIQSGSCDITTRALEAIAYRRRLLTDCPICDSEYFHDGQLQVFSDPEMIDVAFIKRPMTAEQYAPLFDLNPLRRLYDIQEQLERQSNE